MCSLCCFLVTSYTTNRLSSTSYTTNRLCSTSYTTNRWHISYFQNYSAVRRRIWVAFTWKPSKIIGMVEKIVGYTPCWHQIKQTVCSINTNEIFLFPSGVWLFQHSVWVCCRHWLRKTSSRREFTRKSTRKIWIYATRSMPISHYVTITLMVTM